MVALQLAFLPENEQQRVYEAAKEDGCTEAVTTIAPDNEFSLANAYKTGYEVVKTMTIYGGLERCILRKIFE